MELILLEKVQKLGDLGDKVNVKPGYGRNYLVPAGKAVPATKANLAEFEARREELEKAAMAKYWITDTQGEVLDECLQLFGGYGYMQEYAIGEMWADARVQRIYGGTNEIMKELISRSL